MTTVVMNGLHFLDKSFPITETHEKQTALVEILCSFSSLASKRSKMATNAATEPPSEWPERNWIEEIRGRRCNDYKCNDANM